VSVHEYSLDADDIMAGSPWLVGRVKFLFEACRAQGIRPPTVFVTEAGWTHNDLPQADKAREDIDALARLYAGYPTVKAAFLWSAMGGGDKRTLAAELNALLPWLTEYAVTTRLPDVDDGPVEPPPPGPGPVKVLDISKWQGTIHPARMKAAGVDGVMLRAGYATSGGSYRDERVDVFAPALEAEGIPYGLYWYFHPARPVGEQFATFRAAVNQHGYQLRLALDLEETAGVDSSTAAKAGEFAALMAKEYPLPAGKKHLIYTSLGYWRDRLGSPAWGANCDLWIAAWTEAASPLVPVPWSTWALWQYTSDGDGPAHGVGSARVDLNRFNGDAAGFAAWQATEQPPPFEAALWADSLNKRTEWGWNTGAALAKAILGGRLTAADGMIPTGYEIRFEHGGKVWYYQIAHSGDRQTRRVYFVEKDRWNTVRWIDGPGAPVVPPPVESAIDLLPYLRGDGRIYEVRHPSGSTETFQCQTDGDTFYQVKNGQWEQLYADNDFIWRGADTSPGGGRFYVQYEPGMRRARWMPRRMRAGQSWVGQATRCNFTIRRRAPSRPPTAATRRTG
jgi:GH25 family lysozyme M1 (1,4-beta-N-acetylmuramidase)